MKTLTKAYPMAGAISEAPKANKLVLAPTDFSKASVNSVNYAAEMAKLSGAKLVLLHVYEVSFNLMDVHHMLPASQQAEESALKTLQEMRAGLVQKYGSKLEITYECRCGNAVKEIDDYAKEFRADMVVMGMQGKSFFDEKVIGSVTTSLMKKAKYPVLVVDRNMKFKSIDRIAVACDYRGLPDAFTTRFLRNMAVFFDTYVYVLHLTHNLRILSPGEKTRASEKLSDLLKGVRHGFHYVESMDAVYGINQFVKKHRVNMLAMVPQKRSVMGNLLHNSGTGRMSMCSGVPLLSFQEN